MISSALSKEPKFSKHHQLTTNDWPRGSVAMRNYLVPPGDTVRTPEIVRLRDNKIIRPSQELVSGPAAVAVGESKYITGIVQYIAFNSIFYAVNHFILSGLVGWRANIGILLISSIVAWLFYQLCFILGARGIHHFCTENGRETNKIYLASLEQGSKTSQPSRLHKYFVMKYDIPTGRELCVTGKIRRDYQKYWSLVVYDQYGLPLPQYVHDGNATELIGSDPNEYRYDIRLTNHPDDHYTSPYKRAGINEIGVSSVPTGYVLFRLVHPSTDAAAEFSMPTVTLSGDFLAKSTKSE